MRKRLAAILAVGAFGVAMALPAGASADPITCKGNQVVEKTDDGWACVTPSPNENPTGSGEKKGTGDKFGKFWPDK